MAPFTRYDAHAERFFQKLVMLLYFCMLAPFWGTALLYRLYIADANSTGNTVLGLTIFGAGFMSWWFSKITAHYMAVECHPFKLAFKQTFYPVVMKLAFLPFIGSCCEHFLNGKKNDTNEIDNKTA